MRNRTLVLARKSAADVARGTLGGIATWLDETPVPHGSMTSCDSEWREFAKSLCRRGLAGLVLADCNSHGARIPPWVRAALREAASRVASENLHMMHELERILKAFNKNGPPVMLLKGAALNLSVYPNADLRPMSDIDLLVHRGDAERTLRLFEELGYRRGACLMRDDFFPKYHYEVEFHIPSARPVRIDLHARPLRPLRLARIIPDDAFWEGACEVQVGSAKALIPRAEYEFIHLAAHAAYHGCSRLIWLYDLKRVTQAFADTMDWALITARCRLWRLSPAVRKAVAYAEATFGSICPPAVVAELARHRATWRDRLTLSHAPRDGNSPIGHVMCNLLCTPGIVFRLGYLGALLLPSRNHLAGLYKRRHYGWLVCAHLWRILRGFRRAIAVPFVRFAAPAR